MDTFQTLYVAVVFTLEDIFLKRLCNRDTISKALSYYKLLTNFEFIVALVITRSVFDIMLPATLMLQTKTNDIYEGIKQIDALKYQAKKFREDVDTYHTGYYDEAVQIAAKVNVQPSKPRTCGRQVHRNNTPSDSISDYFKNSITIPLLEHVNNQLDMRFNDDSTIPYQGLGIIPSKFKIMVEKGLDWKSRFLQFAEFYNEDMPNPIALKSELDLWERYWLLNKEDCPNNVSATLKAVQFKGFENIKVALRILGTLPVTSCECERSFSSMRRLKSYTRSTMGGGRLNGLALMHVHKDIVINIDKVINKFAIKNRRLHFV